jgi:hypothetical protein
MDIKQKPQRRSEPPEPLLNKVRLHKTNKKHTHGEDGNVMDSICTAIGTEFGSLGNLFDSRQNRMPTPATVWLDAAACFPRSKETAGVADPAGSQGQSQGNGTSDFVRICAKEDQSEVICTMPCGGRPRAAQGVGTLMHDQAAKKRSSCDTSILSSRQGESFLIPKKPQSPELRHFRRCVCVHSRV